MALHALLFGGFNFALPNLKKEMHVIEARIQMPKTVVKPVEAPILEESVAVKQEPPKPQLPKPEKLEKPKKPEKLEKPKKPEKPVKPPPEPVVEESVLPSEASETVLAEITPEPVPEIFPPIEPPQQLPLELPSQLPPELPLEPSKPELPQPELPQPELPQPELPQPESQPIDAGLIINENAYQYLETDFDVRTKIDGSAVGKATINYNLIDGSRYQLKWLTEGRGLAALIFPDLLQTSEGTLTKTGLQPSKYVYQFGDKADKTRTANFDWPNKIATLETSKGTQTVDLDAGTQDLLSFMYQFMFVAPLQTMQINIATGKKLAIYDYSFEGEENLNIKIGELKTIHIVHSGAETDEKTELWLAIDYQYIPVKIRKIEKNGDVVEMVATRINTNRPTQN